MEVDVGIDGAELVAVDPRLQPLIAAVLASTALLAALVVAVHRRALREPELDT